MPLKRILSRLVILAAALSAFSSVASAYYYFVFFPGNVGPFTQIPARFDLHALKANTVQFFISDQGPSALLPGDSTTALYSEIQQAAAVWNGVATSSLRVRFGGITTVGLPQNTPGIDVVFDDDMPPGILAQTKPTFPSDLSFVTAKTTFVPLLRSKVQIRRDLTATGYAQAVYSDTFFATLVHEFGHALGLQHTLTSGVMSTAITRAATKGAPLAADDVAGISLLYPTPGYFASNGSITGQVTRSGAAVNMASVVALSTKGVAISGLTNPDGTYRIDGLPPGQYYIYTHPLPPAGLGEGQPANILPPVDPQNDSFPANVGFGTQFFPGTRDWTQAVLANVSAGKSIDGVNFAVAPRAGPALYGMETYGYENNIPIAAPPLPPVQRNAVVFYAIGATINNQTAMAPGLNVSVIGNAASVEPGSVRYYTQGFLQMVLDTANVTENLPAALAVTVNDDLYVLPVAFTVAPTPPPVVTSVSSDTVLGLHLTTVTGTNFNAGTRILFDGVPAAVTSISSDRTWANIIEPPALSGYQATVEALNPDGQTSLQALGAASPAVYVYPLRDPVSISSAPASLIAGADLTVAITGVNTHFADGQTIAGFGSSDVTVRRAWVVNPQLLLLNVSIEPAARVGPVSLTVSTGLELVTLPNGIQITAADPKQVSLRVPLINASTGLAGVPAGGSVLISTTGLPADLTGWTLSIGGHGVGFSVDKNGVISAAVPADLTPGPQSVKLTAPGTPPLFLVAPVLLQLDTAPPSIQTAFEGVTSATPILNTPGTPAHLGDSILLGIVGLSSNGVLPPASGVWISIGGVNYPATSVAPIPQDPSAVQHDWSYVGFILPAGLTVDFTAQTPAVTIMLGTGTRLSPAFLINVAAPPPPAAQ